ncbi:hypothetical protein CK203_113650 [Vitis vinifera]|uniref:Reverse transcriptase domain-containing protein n=1 Tax=Vitis vinifera TaxID=29760 RepID=A0A438EG62_VITVI|nr:hypothetical protein CK203_113650 [Vitis vinifera]
MRKLQFVKAKLKYWNKNTFGMLKEREKTILDEIANIDANEQEGVLFSDLATQRVDGDCNSKLFHKVANGRRYRNFIEFLENERGLVLDNSESIIEEILLYFKKLYSSPLGESWRVEDRDKASGPDGFTIAVFQDCWDVIKENLVRVFAEFHNSGIINQNTNASFIVLLPKKSQSKKISDFRPISLITCLYKAIRGGGVVFKIDFEMAYDHVKWDFLDHVLEKKGCSSKWRSWMRGCLSSVSYAILVNDVLSRMLLKAEERSLLEGFRVDRCKVSHLQFADDTILFANSSEEELQTFKSLLLVFGQISGLKVNLDKSNLLASTLIRIISLGGMITLLHFFLSHIPSYFLSLFKIPASMAAKVKRMQRDFLWSGVREGKEIILLEVPRESTTLWHQVILSIYGTHSNGWDANTLVRWRWGKNSLLEDLWWGYQIFKDQYPRLFRVVMDKNIPISSILGSIRPFSWNFNFRCNLIDSKIKNLESFMHSLDCMNLSTSTSDARSWSLLSSGLFTVKSFFTTLSQMPDSSPFFPTKFVWKSQVSFKVKAFVWFVAHKKVNTNELLQLRRPHKALSPNICNHDSISFNQDRTALLFLLFPSTLLILRSWIWDGCLPTFPVQLYQAWLLFLYTGLALRENILRVNGSDIRPCNYM